MKVIAIIGSYRKKYSYKAAEQFIANLNDQENIQHEILCLSDYKLKICRGCKLCTDKGEEHCPLKDDRDLILSKMDEAEGVIFVTPNYSFQVSGLMKMFIDHLGFIFHRPKYFGKTFTNIVTQGVYGGNKIVKYLDFVGKPMGFNVVKGSCVTNLEPLSEKVRKKNEAILSKHSRRFYKQLHKQHYPSPSLFDIMMFRLSRTRIKMMLSPEFRDYSYYQKQNWLTSDFYYQVKLNFGQKLWGNFCDWMITRALRSEGF